jgi:2-keto-4-pentenoate hydratase/2-oxohepta-3-ene-1,7-dioic acid hydratase in catechol pathway
MELPGLGVSVGTIWCAGRNYAEHAKELGNPVPAEPVIFLKPASALLSDGGMLILPADSDRVDHEVELVVGLGPAKSLRMAVGVDFTARDLQEKAKKAGLPWTSAKGRRGFAAVGPFVEFSMPARFILRVNGVIRQRGSTRDMLWGVDRLLPFLEGTYGLREGDLLYTGTPAGVGPVAAGDVLEADLEGTESRLRLRVG